MKCAVEPCPVVDHLPLTLRQNGSGQEWSFCGWPHLVAWLIDQVQQRAQLGYAQLLAAFASPEGKKKLVQFLTEKFL
jgi:hypothetical protein